MSQKAKRKKFGRYQNPHKKSLHRGLISWLGFYFGLYDDELKNSQVPHDFTYPAKESQLEHHLPKVTWINHSTFLIEIDGLVILTDPIWSERCSPIKFLGPKRLHPPGKAISELPKIDYVLVSHNHYDHLDRESVRQLHQKNPEIHWIIPKGMSKWFAKQGISKATEFDWWDQIEEKKQNLSITAVPAQHFSGRHPLNVNKTPWNGYVLEFHNLNKKLYFAGDTGYNDFDFKEIGSHFDSFDLSLIPIGAYKPVKFMQSVHVSPFEAVNIHRDTRSKFSIGSHHSTFKLSLEKHNQPHFDLYRAMEEAELDHNKFHVLKPGQSRNW